MRVALPLVVALAAATVFARAVAPQSSESRPGAISGRVVSAYAELVPDATVTLTGGLAPARTWTTTSDRQGEFSFENLPPGEYVLSGARTGYTAREVVEPGRFRPTLEVALVEGERATDVEITLRRSGSIAGRIVQPDGTPAPGTQVVPALRDGDRHVMLHDARTTSEWDGRYEIGGLPPGEFLVVVLPAPPDPAAPASSLPIDVSPAPLKFAPTLYPGVPQSEPGETVAVYEGVATEGIDVWLTPAPQRFTVSGRVFWPEGLEVENLVIEYGGSPAVRSGIWYVDDPGGLFTLTGISQGSLVMLARADSNRGPLVGLATTDVLLGPVEDVRLVIGLPGSVAGRLVYEGSLPSGVSPRVVLAHALLDVSPLFPVEEAAADADGHFRIPQALGAYTIEVRDLPTGWAVRRVQRAGRVLDAERLLVGNGDRIAELEIAVGPRIPSP